MEPTAVVIEFYILEQGTDRLFTGAQRLIAISSLLSELQNASMAALS